MSKRDIVVTYYTNARELIKQRNPRAARAYVVEMLNEALETYHAAATILSKARTAAFMEKWLAVSRDLYKNGITDYVLECFGLATAASESDPRAVSSARKEETPASESREPTQSDDIDFSGLVDEAAETQGWCAKVFAENKAAVVEISVSSVVDGASGTGFIISEEGYLLTNDHVVFDEDNGVYYSKVAMNFVGDKKSYQLEVLFSDRKADVALCKFNPGEISSFSCVKRIADYSTVRQGADCLVIGNAFGMGLAPFTGIIRFTHNGNGNMVYTAPSNPGDSGGPVFNRKGECIGINKSRTLTVNGTAADAYANATPMDKINELLVQWTSKTNIKL